MGRVYAPASDFGYLQQLFGACLDGIASARLELEGRVFVSPKPAAVTAAAIGGVVGVLSVRMAGNRRSASSVAIGGLVGSMVGCSAAALWTSRRFTTIAARRAMHLVNRVRDARWLEKNPIDYA